jgi:rhodanese-related sulfurtransferase
MRTLISTAALALAAAFSIPSFALTTAPDSVSAVQALAMAKSGTLIIDVREAEELTALAYDAPGVVNIPLSELENRMAEVPKDKTVIIACRSGNRSAQAIALLQAKGYTNTVNLSGGLYAWQAAGLPVTKGAAKGGACCAGGKTEAKNCTPEQKAAGCGTAGKAAGCCSGAPKAEAPQPADKTTKKKN